ncbi:MFS transporter, YNFM family, putative membrane transport protein [Paractinoplanes atraurantiacus]|uniref:MFS transporter, YNFM family, putative membrane transport protein n=1 Tax=Paractinoplanes atraurantiacus TaxID=1036182 RepID=A0A285KAJ8_9ACTN|nr:MFS transporter, YNFM family, putative membrane transport protein [Actinoplanes atraurantiacus]
MYAAGVAKVRRTRLIHLSLALSALVGLACAVAPTWHVLLGLRLVQGITLAGLPAVATAYLREELHADTHARAAGLYIGGTALGGMAGRLVTGWVAEAYTWRWALAAVALVGVARAVVVAVLLPKSRHFVPRPADRYGRRAVMPFGCVLTAVGPLLTLPGNLPVMVAGLAVMTAGFFCVHGVAGGWVPVRAHAGGVPAGQAASLYLFAYYAGSSVFGSLAGTAWSLGGWPAVVALASVFAGISGVLAMNLRRVPALEPAVR